MDVSGVIQLRLLSIAHLDLQISDQAREQGTEGGSSSEMSVNRPDLPSVIIRDRLLLFGTY